MELLRRSFLAVTPTTGGVALMVASLLIGTSDAAADPFTLSKATAGGGAVVDFRSDEIESEAALAAGPGYSASAYTDRRYDPFNNTSQLTGGARAATSRFNQFARGEASTEDLWECEGGGCIVGPGAPGFNVGITSRIRFDGVLDPLIADLIAGIDGTDESSLSVYFSYAFPDGTFTFLSCYEPGNAFERAESGCGTPIEAYFDREDGTHVDLTDRLVFGTNAAGAPTVAFNESLAWVGSDITFRDTLTIITEIRSNDSETAHVLDFFNTFTIGQSTSAPGIVFRSALGRTTGPPPGPSVPEPATLGLLAVGVIGAATKRRCAKR
jgi:hypothetical protein